MDLSYTVFIRRMMPSVYVASSSSFCRPYKCPDELQKAPNCSYMYFGMQNVLSHTPIYSYAYWHFLCCKAMTFRSKHKEPRRRYVIGCDLNTNSHKGWQYLLAARRRYDEGTYEDRGGGGSRDLRAWRSLLCGGRRRRRACGVR